jgi:hypothetical protein
VSVEPTPDRVSEHPVGCALTATHPVPQTGERAVRSGPREVSVKTLAERWPAAYEAGDPRGAARL